MIKKISALLLTASLMLTLFACGGDEPADTSAAETTTTAATTPSADDPENEDVPGDTLLGTDEYDIDFARYMTIPDLTAIKGSQSEFDEIWNSYANTIQYDNVILTDSAEGDTAELTDSVNIHYKGYSAVEGVVFSESTLSGMNNFVYDDDGSLEAGYDLVLGSGSFIGAYESEEHPEKNNLGFEEQLVGMKVGETRTITVTFPDGYGTDELKGALVKFDVTVNSLKKGSLPELTDELVASYYDNEITTIDELEDELLSYYAYGLVYQAFTILNYPEEIVDRLIDQYMDEYIAATYENELTEEERQKVCDEQYDNAKAYVEGVVGERMVLEYLFRELDVTLTEAEYLEERAAEYEKNGEYYLFYYGIATEEALEEAIGKDEMVVQFKEMKLRPLLGELITLE